MTDKIQEPAGKSVTPIEAYENLANAIVAKAASDYKAALHALDKNPHSGAAKRMIREVEKFFHSGWYTMLTSLDPDALLAAIKKLVMEEIAEKFERDKKRLVKEAGEAGCTIDATTVYYLTTVEFAGEQSVTQLSRWSQGSDKFSADAWWRDPFGLLMFIEYGVGKDLPWSSWQLQEAEAEQMARLQMLSYDMLPWESLEKAAGEGKKKKTGKAGKSAKAAVSAKTEESAKAKETVGAVASN